MPHTIAALVSSSHVRVTLHELDTVYGVMDLWDLLEVNAVEIHNENVINKNG